MARGCLAGSCAPHFFRPSPTRLYTGIGSLEDKASSKFRGCLDRKCTTSKARLPSRCASKCVLCFAFRHPASFSIRYITLTFPKRCRFCGTLDSRCSIVEFRDSVEFRLRQFEMKKSRNLLGGHLSAPWTCLIMLEMLTEPVSVFIVSFVLFQLAHAHLRYMKFLQSCLPRTMRASTNSFTPSSGSRMNLEGQPPPQETSNVSRREVPL